MNRIIEAFNKPYFEMTAIDGLIVGTILTFVFVIGYLAFLWFAKESNQ